MSSISAATIVAAGLRNAAAKYRPRHLLPITLLLPVSSVVLAASLRFDIPAQPLADALKLFADQAKMQLLYKPGDIGAVTSHAVVGDFDTREALELMLRDTGFEVIYSKGNAATVRPSHPASQAAAPDASARLMLAQTADTVDTENRGPAASTADSASPPNRRTPSQTPGEPKLDEVLVTGSHIRGGAPDSSPVRIYDRQAIIDSGAATAQEFVNRLPQNFGGGSTEQLFFGAPGDSNGSFNGVLAGSMGTGVNLRGLGSGSTLVLLNGQRMAPSSGIGDFVDISMIPASALERVEVLSDGASSIYGGDAVAGVVNFILRDNFEGLEADLRYGTATEGGYDESRAGLTGGTSWGSGNALLAYEYYKQNNLSAADRDFSKSATLPNDLLPAQARHSVLASGSQRLTDDLKLTALAGYSARKAVQSFYNPAASRFHSEPTSNSLNTSLGATWHLFNSWYADFSGAYSDVHEETHISGDIQGRRNINSSMWSLDAKASGALLALPGGDLRLAFGGQYREEDFTNKNRLSGVTDRKAARDARAVFAELSVPIVGSGNVLPGVQRLELNLSGRLDDYSDFGSTTNEKFGVLWSPIDKLKLRGSYSTSFNPPPLGRVGATDLGALVDSTADTNASFGFTADPAIADVVAITVFGTAKDLQAETSRTYTAGLEYKDRRERHDYGFAMNWFDIKFEDRLSTVPVPVTNNPYDAPNKAYADPSIFPPGTVIFGPTQAQITDLLASLYSINLLADPLEAQIINLTGVVRNVSQTLVSGIDVDFNYGFDSTLGYFTFDANTTWLHKFQVRAGEATSIVSKLNTLYNPIDLKMRGHAGYRRGKWNANLFVNYQDDYRIDGTATSKRVGSWTTFDSSLSYELAGTTLSLFVFNVLDRDPPFTLNNAGYGVYGFDPVNATPRGRFVTFECVKRF